MFSQKTEIIRNNESLTMLCLGMDYIQIKSFCHTYFPSLHDGVWKSIRYIGLTSSLHEIESSEF